MLIGWIRHCNCEADFSHKRGDGKVVGAMELDHYSHQCPDPLLPRPYCVAAWKDATEHRYEREEWVPSGSQLTNCPIETALKVQNGYIEDILNDRKFLLRGTFGHEGFEERVKGHPDYITEQKMELPLEFDDGLKFSVFGTLDLYYKPEESLEDYKTQGEYAVKKKMKQSDEEIVNDARTGAFVRDNMNQINVYRVMAEETQGLKVSRLKLWYMSGAMEWRGLPVPLVPKDRMLEVMRKRFRDLYEAVHGIRPLESFTSKYGSINEFPANKSPVGYLLKKYI